MFFLIGDSVAFNRFLNRFVVRPKFKAVAFDIRKDFIVIFSQCGCKIPRDHHSDIVFVPANGADTLGAFRREAFAEEKSISIFIPNRTVYGLSATSHSGIFE